MEKMKLAEVESRFADILWKHAPLSTKEMIAICQKELHWQRSTTYTVLKKLCQREMFKLEDGVVTALVTREEFYSICCEQFVETKYNGSLPAFIAAFASRKSLSRKELAEIREMIDSIEG